MESDTHFLYFTKLSGKSQDFYFLVGIHLNSWQVLYIVSQIILLHDITQDDRRDFAKYHNTSSFKLTVLFVLLFLYFWYLFIYFILFYFFFFSFFWGVDGWVRGVGVLCFFSLFFFIWFKVTNRSVVKDFLLDLYQIYIIFIITNFLFTSGPFREIILDAYSLPICFNYIDVICKTVYALTTVFSYRYKVG